MILRVKKRWSTVERGREEKERPGGSDSVTGKSGLEGGEERKIRD